MTGGLMMLSGSEQPLLRMLHDRNKRGQSAEQSSGNHIHWRRGSSICSRGTVGLLQGQGSDGEFIETINCSR
ncbi:hypothetical protein KUCAC02_004796, partial [Chaenocephalus aceratus]